MKGRGIDLWRDSDALPCSFDVWRDSYSWSLLWLPDVFSSRHQTWGKGEPDWKEFRLLYCFPTLCVRKNETWCRGRYRVWVESGTVRRLSLCDSKTHSQSAHRLSLRWEAGVKLTPDPINCLILKNGFNLCKPTFVTFNIFSLTLICDA